jgi:hypothetical protein
VGLPTRKKDTTYVVLFPPLGRKGMKIPKVMKDKIR